MTLHEKYKDFIGKKFCHMTILEIEPLRVDGKVMVNCRCDCGNVKTVRLRHLQEGLTKSCGMCEFRKIAVRNACSLDLRNREFGELVALEPTDNRSGSFVLWKCKCKRCGRIVEVSTNRLMSGRRKSCGMCGYKAEKTREWCKKYFTDDQRSLGLVVFPDMLARCYNKNCPDYKTYGARGVYICDEWIKDRTKFVQWGIEHGYHKGLTIDRFPIKDGPYAPWNCRWISIDKQQINRTDNRLITVNGIEHPCSEWARLYNVSPDRFYRLSDRDIIRTIEMLDKGKRELGDRYAEFKNKRVLSSSTYRKYFGDSSKIISNDRGNKMVQVCDINQSCTRWDTYFMLPDGYVQKFYKEHGKEETERMIFDRLAGKWVDL